MPRYFKPLKPFARKLRKAQTPAEDLLWAQIRRKRLMGVQFYRQRPIHRFIVDFHAAAPPIVIELDGKHHQSDPQKSKDEIRDQKLQQMGFRVLRFPNAQVEHNMQSVLATIIKAIKQIKRTTKNADDTTDTFHAVD
jgi:very-short-patch-repair endonuclease